MLLLTGGLWIVLAYSILVLSVGWLRATTAAFIIAAMVFPDRLTHFSTYSYTGIAASAPEVSTYTVVAILGGIQLLLARQPVIPRAFVPFLLFLAFGLFLLWPSSPLHYAGAAQFVTALIAGGLGIAYGRKIVLADEGFQLFLVRVLGLVVAIQLSIGMLQLLGVPVFELDTATAALMDWRIGTALATNPNNLGKVMFVIVGITLPLTQLRNPRTRRLSYLTLTGAVLTTVFTGGRANLIAVLVAVVVFVIASRRMRGQCVASPPSFW